MLANLIGQFEFATYGGPPLSAKNRNKVFVHMLLSFKAVTTLSRLSSMQVVIAANVRRFVSVIHEYFAMYSAGA